MMRGLPLLCGLFVIASAAWLQGNWTQRWNKSGVLEAAAQRLRDAPENLGTWKAEPMAFDAQALADAGAQGSWLRRYTDSRSGAAVTIILLCGRSGKMSV
ncbi:MAG: exosortase-associated EpsI family protein, partial [Gemmataceae bacterium]